jgi:hypothetical protein
VCECLATLSAILFSLRALTSHKHSSNIFISDFVNLAKMCDDLQLINLVTSTGLHVSIFPTDLANTSFCILTTFN